MQGRRELNKTSLKLRTRVCIAAAVKVTDIAECACADKHQWRIFNWPTCPDDDITAL